jgi:hypothetical protein
MTASQLNTLAYDLSMFIGTENWYKHRLNPLMTHTDGIKFFADKAECYWLLDIIVTEFFPLLVNEPFLVIAVYVENAKCRIVVTDGNYIEIKSKYIDFTDLPEGKWTFYLTDNVLLLPSEY